MAGGKVKEMKRTEKKVRDEISGTVINHHTGVGKGHIGEIFIEVYKYRDGLLIDCFLNNTVYVRLIINSEDVVRRFIVAVPVGKELTKLRLLLEKLKR